MKKIRGILSTNNKRLKFCIAVLSLNFISFWLGMYFKADLTELGVGLAALNAPLYVYVLGETFRASKQSIDEPRNNESGPRV